MTKTSDFVKGLILKAIDEGYPPPNAPSTIARKGFDHPLIETGEMRDSLEVDVEHLPNNGFRIKVGFYGEENAKKALINNYGVPGKIPARPVFTATIDENMEAIAEVASQELFDSIFGGKK